MSDVKTVAVFGKSVSVSVSALWNASLIKLIDQRPDLMVYSICSIVLHFILSAMLLLFMR